MKCASIIVVIGMMVSAATPTLAEFDIFLKIDGVEGEARDARHAGEINVLSWDWGLTQPGSILTGPGRATLDDVSLVKHLDKSTPQLMLSCSFGTRYDSAVITVQQTSADGPRDYLVITLTDVLVTSVKTGAAATDSVPTENISLNFGKIEVKYIEYKDTGTVVGEYLYRWDVAANADY